MKLREILGKKGNHVLGISPAESLADVVAKLNENNCGSLVVRDGDALVGIITERDILKACANRSVTLEETRVEQVMTRKLVTGELDDDVQKIMGLLTKNRIRHLPVLEEGKLVGMISIGDVVKAQHDELAMENYYLKDYIHQS